MECIDISKHCRACQRKTQAGSQILIFAILKLSDIFKETTSLDIQENDGLPKVLCCSCYDRLLEAYNFRKMCSGAVSDFLKILPIKDVPWEKYTSRENKSAVHLTDRPLMEVETDSDSNSSSPSFINPNSRPRRDDYPIIGMCDMSEMDYKLLETVLTDSDSDDPIFSKKSQKAQKEEDKPPKKTIKRSIPSKLRTKLECSSCNLSFYQKSHLERHIWKEHQELKPCECQICGKRFESTSSLRNNLKTHEMAMGDDSQNDTIQNDCTICGIQKATKDELKIHVKTHRKDDIWCCVFCTYKALKLCRMKSHVELVHKKVRKFQCTRCERYFSTSGVLKLHMRRHEGIKNFECSFCGVKKFTRIELENHMGIHTKEKKLSCKYCTYKTNYSINLRQHTNAIHDNVRYECSYCGKSLISKWTLNNHIMVHTGEKPHACNKCPKRFIALDRLKIHMKTHTV